MRPTNQKVTKKAFASIASTLDTDKETFHKYSRFYPSFLSEIDRNEHITVLEIGYGSGGSIPLWHHLFPNSFVFCIDRDVEEEGPNFKVIKADQSNPYSITDAMPATEKPIKLIIDDGSHHPKHQLSTFSQLFTALLEPGGCYIIEDIETSYWTAGNLYGNELRYGISCKWSCIEAIKLLADYINRKYISEEDRSALEYAMMTTGLSPEAGSFVNTLSFGQNCIAITKSFEEDIPHCEGDYEYAAFTKR